MATKLFRFIKFCRLSRGTLMFSRLKKWPLLKPHLHSYIKLRKNQAGFKIEVALFLRFGRNYQHIPTLEYCGSRESRI